MTDTAMTVLGPVAGDKLGPTLMHEHLFTNFLLEHQANDDGLLDDYESTVEEVLAFKRAGGGTIVECTNEGIANGIQCKAEKLRRVSEATGLNIVMGVGYYRDPFMDKAWLNQHSVDQIAERIVTALEVGAEQLDESYVTRLTNIRGGIIGEVGTDQWFMSAVEERSFRAAARASRKTGVAISTHAARWTGNGIAQLDVIESEGVDPRRVIIGHCSTIADMDYHEAVARRGSYAQFDTISGGNARGTALQVSFLKNLIEKGYVRQILISQDVFTRRHLHSGGGTGYDYILTKFLPELRKAGISDQHIDEIMIHNPRRALTGAID